VAPIAEASNVVIQLLSSLCKKDIPAVLPLLDGLLRREGNSGGDVVHTETCIKNNFNHEVCALDWIFNL